MQNKMLINPLSWLMYPFVAYPFTNYCHIDQISWHRLLSRSTRVGKTQGGGSTMCGSLLKEKRFHCWKQHCWSTMKKYMVEALIEVTKGDHATGMSLFAVAYATRREDFVGKPKWTAELTMMLCSMPTGNALICLLMSEFSTKIFLIRL